MSQPRHFSNRGLYYTINAACSAQVGGGMNLDLEFHFNSDFGL